MLRETAARGRENALVAGASGTDRFSGIDGVEDARCRFLRFDGEDLAHPVAGMSDVMPYPSIRFRDMTSAQVEAYESAFADAIAETAAAWKPDRILAHHLWLMTAVARLTLPDLPMAVVCHGSDLRQFRQVPHLADRVLGAFRDVESVCALSRAQRTDLIDLHGLDPNRVHVVGAGFNRDRFCAGEKLPAPPVRLLYAGKLSRSKGVPHLLRALAQLELDWHLDLVGSGSGEEQEECLSLAAELGTRVTPHGQIPQRDLADLMARAHIFVLPSFFEGLPLVLLEALASGCRVTATALPGVEELLGEAPPDAVQLVPPPRLENTDEPLPEDEAGFVRALARSVQSQAKRLSGRLTPDPLILEPLLARCTWSAVLDRMEGAGL